MTEGYRSNPSVATVSATCAPLCALISQVDRLPAEVIPPALALLRAVAVVLPDVSFLRWAAPEALLFGGYVAWQSNSSFILQDHYGLSLTQAL